MAYEGVTSALFGLKQMAIGALGERERERDEDVSNEKNYKMKNEKN